MRGARSASGLEYSVQSAIIARIRGYQRMSCSLAVRRTSLMIVDDAYQFECCIFYTLKNGNVRITVAHEHID